MIDPGKMDRKIIIQRNTGATQDAIGAPVENWTTLCTAWAQVKPMSGRDAYKSQRQTSTQVCLFVLWFDSDIKSTDRISYDDKLWNITNIAELGYKEGLEITAEVVQ